MKRENNNIEKLEKVIIIKNEEELTSAIQKSKEDVCQYYFPLKEENKFPEGIQGIVEFDNQKLYILSNDELKRQDIIRILLDSKLNVLINLNLPEEETEKIYIKNRGTVDNVRGKR